MPILPLAGIFARYPVQRIVSYHHADKRFLTLTLELGMDGMRIETHDRLPHGEQVNFQLVLGEHSIWSRGRVVRSEVLTRNRTVSDIEFVQLTEPNLAALQEHLAALDNRPKPPGGILYG